MGAVRLGAISLIPGTSDVLVVDVDDIEMSLPDGSDRRHGQSTRDKATNRQSKARAKANGGEQAATSDKASDRTQAALDAVSAYVPGEALGFYITATALLGTPTVMSDASVAAATIGLAALLVTVSYRQLPANYRSKSKYRWALLFAMVGAAVYISALPASFTHHWSFYTGPVSAVVVIAVSIVMTSVGSLVGLTSRPRRH